MKIATPHAEVIVWNYKQRMTADKLSDFSSTEDPFLLSGSIIKISTSKSKSSPTGQFEIVLAPTHNWVARITPGSWCVILMSPVEPINLTPKNVGQVEETKLKMLGRIDSVRSSISVDGEGNRVTSYIATGVDWGSMFETNVYLDPIVLTSGVQSLGGIGQAQATIYSKYVNDAVTSGGLPTTTDNAKALIGLWGAAGASLVPNIKMNLPSVTGIQMSSGVQYVLPDKLAKYLGIKTNMAENLQIVSGKLSSYDTYEDVKEAHSFIEPQSVLGTHTLWQLLNDNTNNILNELVVELRWPTKGCALTLYKRARPFLTRPLPKSSQKAEAVKSASEMKNVRAHVILSEHVISCNAGTNWRDSFNFIEVMPRIPIEALRGLTNEAKANAQVSDISAFARDGFRPLIMDCHYLILPDKDGKQDSVIEFSALTQWKYLLQEWYFNTQSLLNGSMSFIGQPHYIGVGDNIMVDTKVLGLAPMSSGQSGETYLLAHVENISHDFAVDSEGSRSFFTSVNFVRGIIVDKNRNTVLPEGTSLDRDASSLPEASEIPPNTVFTGAR